MVKAGCHRPCHALHMHRRQTGPACLTPTPPRPATGNGQAAWAQAAADSGEGTDLEALCSQLTLDVIGKAVFNYDFDALTTNSPLIQVQPLPPPPAD